MKNNLSNRKKLYFIFGLVLVFVVTLSVVYAALNAVLEITGNAEVNAAEWDIRLENPIVKSGSVNSNLPIITSNKEASFSATLNTPGDFYEFSIDVVNNGSIDAMIESVEKTPTLSTEQAKFLNYIIEYENGESISTKQLVGANSFVRLKVKVEFRKDINSTDLPSVQNVLDLSFKLNYVQADDEGTTIVPDNGIYKLVKIKSGNLDTTGSEICIDKECFYVISSTENDVTMLSKYNLHVGYVVNGYNNIGDLENPTGIQNETALGSQFDGRGFEVYPFMGTIEFCDNSYWYNSGLKPAYGNSYPAHVYDPNSFIYPYVENYKSYLISLGVTPSEARLLYYSELEALGCDDDKNNCYDAFDWVYSTSYWTGDTLDYRMWAVGANGTVYGANLYNNNMFGIRPVITISKSLFE